MHTTAQTSPIKIIWNITDKCHYRCEVCATHDEGRRQLNYAEQKALLHNLYGTEASIKEIDFAGGDPLFDPQSKDVIREAIGLFGEDRICVTTTGYGIEQLDESEKELFLTNCELTIDSSELNTSIRRETTYGVSNHRAALENARFFKRLTINTPIIDCDLTEDEISRLAEMINAVDVKKTVSLIRLMPVGKMSISNYPTDYDPESVINRLKSKLTNADVHLQCALRGKYSGERDNCGMVRRKLGIDCEGNLFSCAWAGYIDRPIKDNPFF